MEGKNGLNNNKNLEKLKAISYFPCGNCFLLGLREVGSWKSARTHREVPVKEGVGEAGTEGPATCYQGQTASGKPIPSKMQMSQGQH